MSQLEGIVLRTTDYSENHLIVTILTASIGKISLMARGAKKTASPLRACTTPFTHAAFQVYGTKMPNLQQASIISGFRKIKADLEATAFAAYAVELADRILPDREPSPGVFSLLLWVLNSIEQGVSAEMCVRVLEARMLDLAGVMPAWLQCAACLEPLTESPFYSPRLGGPLHLECGYRDRQAISTRLVLPKLIYTLQKVPLERIGSISVSDEARKQIAEIFRHLLEDYAGIHLRSRRFLEALDF